MIWHRSSDTKKVDLIIFMGQSNMAGRGRAEEAPILPPGIAFEFKPISDPTRLYHLCEPFGVEENNFESGVAESNKTGSMVSSFALEYNKMTGQTIIGVSCSKGGTSIEQWQPEGSFLSDAISRYRTTEHWLLDNGYTIMNTFMVWCQGETDGDQGMTRLEYTLKLTTMIDAMIGAGIDRCYIVTIGNHRDHAERYQEIRAAQLDVCRQHNYAVLVSTEFEHMAASGLMTDEFHYSQQGYNMTGTDAGLHTALDILARKKLNPDKAN